MAYPDFHPRPSLLTRPVFLLLPQSIIIRMLSPPKMDRQLGATRTEQNSMVTGAHRLDVDAAPVSLRQGTNRLFFAHRPVDPMGQQRIERYLPFSHVWTEVAAKGKQAAGDDMESSSDARYVGATAEHPPGEEPGLH